MSKMIKIKVSKFYKVQDTNIVCLKISHILFNHDDSILVENQTKYSQCLLSIHNKLHQNKPFRGYYLEQSQNRRTKTKHCETQQTLRPIT